eukprot:125359-Hanusia_phi.AAC.1
MSRTRAEMEVRERRGKEDRRLRSDGTGGEVPVLSPRRGGAAAEACQDSRWAALRGDVGDGGGELCECE